VELSLQNYQVSGIFQQIATIAFAGINAFKKSTCDLMLKELM